MNMARRLQFLNTLICFFVLSFVSANAGMLIGSGAVGGGTPNCSTITHGATTSEGNNSEASVQATEYTHSVATCKIDTIEAYIEDFDSPTECVFGLYTDGTGKPGNIIAYATTGDPPASFGWVSATITETTLTNGVTYWIGFQCNDQWSYKYETGTSNFKNDAYDGTLNDWGAADNDGTRDFYMRLDHS
jgi:hypothetical protein